MTGACHAPVGGRQGKPLSDTDPSAFLVPIKKSADLEMDGSLEANAVAERLTITPNFENVGTTHKPRNTA